MPDSITSWVASAFAVSSSTGFGVARDTATVRVFRPFFVSLNLPYSVIRGEHVILQAIVFNYMQQDQDVRVTLAQSQDFYNLEVDAGGQEDLRREDKEINVHTVQAADAVRRNLKVEAEGVPKEYNVGVLLDLKNTTSFSRDVNLTLPPNVVSDSELLRVTAIGDVMSPSINGLDSLLRMPTGCGEQNMLGMAPDVFVTRYLTATNQLTEDIADTAVSFMEHGYQRELTYQHMDGSFSTWGQRDPSGSTWLLQGGAARGPGLTAFVLISLLENNGQGARQRVKDAQVKAVDYLKHQLPTITDNYVLAIVSYALTLAGDPAARTTLTRLENNAIVEGKMKHWQGPDTSLPANTGNYWQRPYGGSARDVEITSYALLTYAASRDYVGGLSDTIIALQALSEFASLAGSGDSQDIEVDVTAGSFTPHFTVTKGNALVLQSAETKAVPDTLTVSATGSGVGLLQVDVFFNVEAEVEEPAFELHVNLTKDTLNLLEMETCARWLAVGSSGMAVQEVGIPSGFEVDMESLLGPYTLKRRETENTKLILYFDEIGAAYTCARMSLLRTRMVAKSKPVAVRVYDYYQPEYQATSFYQSTVLKGSSVCDLCEECGCPMMKDVPMLSTGPQTASIEGFHSVLNHFAPKMYGFSYSGILHRNVLAALHFNENNERKQATRLDGTPRFRVAFKKARKSFALEPVKISCTYGYVDELQEQVVELASVYSIREIKELLKEHEATHAPPPLCVGYEHLRPDKAEAIRAHLSRFIK
ncbi:hypothetical protein BaRGS_00035155 [Batillaria attramentaria]|uniref:Uncharacterized protein n=2 Tax=Batillaria attramentaria TaxID=370345 RepID=A0ABD0JFJ0_9CAEN